MTAIALSPLRRPLPRRRSRRPRADATSCIVRADFDRVDGARWSSVGGGRNVAEALADARRGLPAGTWELVAYADGYGD